MPYFNSRPSARGDCAEKPRMFDTPISIHAPPRGATVRANCPAYCGVISIHAPPRGATGSAWVADEAWVFQFTPLREGRPFHALSRRGLAYFNSRPSARGDGCGNEERVLPRDFNSRPSARGDIKTVQTSTHHLYFNSRPSARGDAKPRRSIVICSYFNSRPSARGDAKKRLTQLCDT